MTQRPVTLRVVLAEQAEIAPLTRSDLAELFGDGITFDTRVEARMQAFSDDWNSVNRVTLRDLCPVDSPSEKRSFAEGVRTAAQLSECFGGLEVNRRPVVSALAWAIMSPVRLEWQLFDCLCRIADQGLSQCTVYSETLTAPLEAAILRVSEMGLFHVEAIYELREGQVRARTAPSGLDQLRQAVSHPKSRKLALTLPTPAMTTSNGDADARLPLISLHSVVPTGSIEMAHTLRVLRAFERAQQPYRLMSLAPAEDHAARFAETAGLEQAQVLSFDRVDMRAIAAPLNLMRDALSTADLPLSASTAVTPHLMFAQGSLFNIWRKNVGLFLNIQAALAAPTRSIWIGSQFGVANQAVLECAGTVPVFTAPTASISHHIRALPYLDPRVHYLSYGTAVSDIYAKRGLAAEPRVHPVGALYCDPAETSSVRSTAQLTILVMSARMSPQSEDAWLAPLAGWAVSNGHDLRIRRHPTRPGNYDAVMDARASGPGSTGFTTDQTPEACLAAADIVVSDASTSALLAAIRRKPLVQVETSDMPFEYNDLGGFGASVKTCDAATTLAAVERIAGNLLAGHDNWWDGFSTPDYASFDQAFDAPGQGTPADRTRELMLDPPPAPRAMTPGTRLILKNIDDDLPI